jgi:hypothetical protein
MGPNILSEMRAILDSEKSAAKPATSVTQPAPRPVLKTFVASPKVPVSSVPGSLAEAVREAPTSAPWWLEGGAPSNWLANPLSLQSAFVNAAMPNALKSGHTLYKGSGEGTPTVTPAAFLKLLVQAGWRLALVRGTQQDYHLCADFVRDDGVFVVEMTADDFLYGSYATTNADVAAQIEKILQANTKTTPPTGAVYALVNQGMGVSLMNLGRMQTPLNRANYAPEVEAAFDRVVADLQSAHPSGRLVILEGPPGTGKSFWVRGLVQASNDATFVLIPPDMVGSLAHPSLLPVLARHRESHNAPVVLILEDAEACLLPRKDGSAQAGAVSTLLNLGDGIFGQLLDVRIVATTNTKKVDFDPAFSAPGSSFRGSDVRAAGARAIRCVAEDARPWHPQGRVAYRLADARGDLPNRAQSRVAAPAPRNHRALV